MRNKSEGVGEGGEEEGEQEGEGKEWGRGRGSWREAYNEFQRIVEEDAHVRENEEDKGSAEEVEESMKKTA